MDHVLRSWRWHNTTIWYYKQPLFIERHALLWSFFHAVTCLTRAAFNFGLINDLPLDNKLMIIHITFDTLDLSPLAQLTATSVHRHHPVTPASINTSAQLPSYWLAHTTNTNIRHGYLNRGVLKAILHSQLHQQHPFTSTTLAYTTQTWTQPVT